MNMEEIWKDISGYEGKYQVSSLGRVKSLNYNRTKKEKILKGGKDNVGYLSIRLCKEGKPKTYRVHRLVAESFIDNPHNYPIINHKDEDKTNNCIENLEWCTQKYNNTYGTCINRRVANTDYKAIAAKIDYKEVGRKNSEKLLNRKDKSKPVLQFTKDNKFVKEWVSNRECERNGYDHSAVASCCKGKLKSYKGFIWKYKND